MNGTSCLCSAAAYAVSFIGRMAGLDATKTGYDLSQPKFEFKGFILIELQFSLRSQVTQDSLIKCISDEVKVTKFPYSMSQHLPNSQSGNTMDVWLLFPLLRSPNLAMSNDTAQTE